MGVKFFNFTAWSKLAIFYEMAVGVIRFIVLLSSKLLKIILMLLCLSIECLIFLLSKK